MGCLLEKEGIPFLYEPDRIPYNKPHHYVPDFRVVDRQGHTFYIEVKGRFLPSDRTKHRLIKEQHPDIDIRFVFQQPKHRLTPKSKTTYAQWCDRHGFLWSDKRLPKSWFS